MAEKLVNKTDEAKRETLGTSDVDTPRSESAELKEPDQGDDKN